jgi:hypothetical protein
LIPFELTDEQLAELGRLSANSATLERATKNLIAYFLDNDPWIGEIVTASLTLPKALDVLDALVRYRSEDKAILDQVKDALDKAARAHERRNSLIHARWSSQTIVKDGHTLVAAMRTRTTVKRNRGVSPPEFQPMSVADLREAAAEVEEAAYAVAGLFEVLGRAGVLKGVHFGAS